MPRQFRRGSSRPSSQPTPVGQLLHPLLQPAPAPMPAAGVLALVPGTTTATVAHHQLRPLPSEQGQPLAVFDRMDAASRSQLRVTWASYNGHRYLSLRVWCELPDGRWVPDSRRGCTVRLRELERFRDAVLQAVDIVAHQVGLE